MRQWRWIEAGCIAGLVVFALYFLTGFRFGTLFTVVDRQVDFQIWWVVAGEIKEFGRYPASVTGDWANRVLPYAPSGAAMLLLLHALPRLVAFGVWIALQGLAFAAVLWASLRMSGGGMRREALLIALIASLFAASPIGWDFRNHNTNMIYLALVMLGAVTHRTWLAALLFALSFNLKLYSVLIPVVLAWRREIALAVATMVVSALIFVALPIVVFGVAPFPQLLIDWYGQVQHTVPPQVQSQGPATLIRTVAVLLARDPSAPEVTTVLRAVQLGWLVLVAAYFLTAGRAAPTSKEDATRARLADLCVALMAPLPLSTWLVPYHTVVLLPAFVLLLTVAAKPAFTMWLRGGALAAVLACGALRLIPLGEDYRGGIYLTSFVIIGLALAVVRGFPQSRGAVEKTL
ncbi:MAG TPA: glycosyltransferase family 87 protein [Pseudolabrys sp.]|nr:glycosyltransferase family 87 protein [Pseudolabrys sp.]